MSLTWSATNLPEVLRQVVAALHGQADRLVALAKTADAPTPPEVVTARLTAQKMGGADLFWVMPDMSILAAWSR